MEKNGVKCIYILYVMVKLSNFTLVERFTKESIHFFDRNLVKEIEFFKNLFGKIQFLK